MSSLDIFYLDPADTERIEQYERQMFRAYYGATKTLELTRHIDKKNRRIRSKIPYEDQKIIIAEVNGKMIAGMGVNFNMNGTLNLENLGFSIDKSQEKIAEGTGMFCNTPFVDGKMVMYELFMFGNVYLKENQYKTMYGFCGQKLVRSFKSMGFSVLEEKEVEGETMFLLSIDIEQ